MDESLTGLPGPSTNNWEINLCGLIPFGLFGAIEKYNIGGDSPVRPRVHVRAIMGP